VGLADPASVDLLERARGKVENAIAFQEIETMNTFVTHTSATNRVVGRSRMRHFGEHSGY